MESPNNVTDIGRTMRPAVGSLVTSIMRQRICKQCGNVVSSTGLCDHDCEADGESRDSGNTFVAVYEQTWEFLGDEEI